MSNSTWEPELKPLLANVMEDTGSFTATGSSLDLLLYSFVNLFVHKGKVPDR